MAAGVVVEFAAGGVGVTAFATASCGLALVPELVLDPVSDFVAAGGSGMAPVVAGAVVGAVWASAYEAPNVTAKNAAEAAAVRKRTVVSIDQLRENGTRHSNQVSGLRKTERCRQSMAISCPIIRLWLTCAETPDAVPLAVARRRSGSLATLCPASLPENHAKT